MTYQEFRTAASWMLVLASECAVLGGLILAIGYDTSHRPNVNPTQSGCFEPASKADHPAP
jgi:hypothetical protein